MVPTVEYCDTSHIEREKQRGKQSRPTGLIRDVYSTISVGAHGCAPKTRTTKDYFDLGLETRQLSSTTGTTGKRKDIVYEGHERT